MKSVKHILILTPGFPKNETDTTCIPPLQAFVHELQSAHASEVKLYVITFQYPFTAGSYIWNDVSCWSAGGANQKFPFKILTWIRVLIHAYRHHRKNPFHIVHSFWLQDCTLIGSIFSWLTGSKLVAHAMGQDILENNRYLEPRRGGGILRVNNIKIIANSPFSAAMLKQEYNLNAFKVFVFGIQPSDFIKMGTSERKTDLLSVGSLIELKNQKLFIELFAILKKSIPSLKGSIIGGGPLAGELERLIHFYNLNDCLIMEGSLNRSEVLLRMTQSKILLHTSKFESAAYVFLEALYSGMNVVSFKTGYLPDVPGAFACVDEIEMVEKIKNLLASPGDYERKQVPLIKDTADKMVSVYNNL